MKAKLKFDKTLILGFFVEHGEKIGFAAVVLCFALLIYLATTTKRYDKTPDDLMKAADAAELHIQQSRTDVPGVNPIDPRKEIETISAPKTPLYEWPTILDPPIDDPKRLRDQPVLYAVEELRGTGGVGRFGDSRTGTGPAAIGREGGGVAAAAPEALGQRWVVLTGIVDYKKYQESFRKCFKNVVFSSPDDYRPVFVYYRVQRVEVTDENEPIDEKRWKKPYETTLKQEFQRFRRGGDLAENRLLDRALAFPLPARSDEPWDTSVVYHPRIPFEDLRQTTRTTGETEKPAGDVPDEPDPVGGWGGRTGMGDTNMGETYGSGMHGHGSGVGEVGGGPMHGGLRHSGQQDLAPLRLFRFIDFNVEPGKRYRYRARLLVKNPNYKLDERYLVKELRERSKDKEQWRPYIVTQWSDPSDVIVVPRDDRLLTVSVAPARGIDGDPSGMIMAIHWNRQKGEEIHDEFKIWRGWLANFLDQKLPVREESTQQFEGGHPRAGELGEGELLGGRERKKSKKQPKIKLPTVDYMTEMLVLDLRGGQRLPGKNRLMWPGEMLLLDPDGNLQVRSDVEDRQACDDQKNPAKSQGYHGMPGEMRGGPEGGLEGLVE